MKPKFLTLVIILSLGAKIVFAQEFSLIASGTQNDSSYYDVLRVAPDKVWLCGKYGVLNEIDSNFHVHAITLPKRGFHLLKMENLAIHQVQHPILLSEKRKIILI